MAACLSAEGGSTEALILISSSSLGALLERGFRARGGADEDEDEEDEDEDEDDDESESEEEDELVLARLFFFLDFRRDFLLFFLRFCCDG